MAYPSISISSNRRRLGTDPLGSSRRKAVQRTRPLTNLTNWEGSSSGMLHAIDSNMNRPGGFELRLLPTTTSINYAGHASKKKRRKEASLKRVLGCPHPKKRKKKKKKKKKTQQRQKKNCASLAWLPSVTREGHSAPDAFPASLKASAEQESATCGVGRAPGVRALVLGWEPPPKKKKRFKNPTKKGT